MHLLYFYIYIHICVYIYIILHYITLQYKNKQAHWTSRPEARWTHSLGEHHECADRGFRLMTRSDWHRSWWACAPKCMMSSLQESSNNMQLAISSGAALDCATAGDESAAASSDWRVPSPECIWKDMDIPISPKIKIMGNPMMNPAELGYLCLLINSYLIQQCFSSRMITGSARLYNSDLVLDNCMVTGRWSLLSCDVCKQRALAKMGTHFFLQHFSTWYGIWHIQFIL